MLFWTTLMMAKGFKKGEINHTIKPEFWSGARVVLEESLLEIVFRFS